MAGKQNHGGALVGGALLLVVFIVLCLTTFAALSISSVRADGRMTARTGQAVAAYYAADALAEEKLAEIDRQLAKLAAECSALVAEQREAAYLSGAMSVSVEGVAAVNGALFYDIPLEDGRQSLFVEISPEWPSEGGPRFTRTAWNVAYTAEWKGDERMNLWVDPGAAVE